MLKTLDQIQDQTAKLGRMSGYSRPIRIPDFYVPLRPGAIHRTPRVLTAWLCEAPRNLIEASNHRMAWAQLLMRRLGLTPNPALDLPPHHQLWAGGTLYGLDFACGLDLDGCDFHRRCFAGATLDGASFRGANLRCANFRGASLVSCDFSEANATAADFRGADLTETKWDRATAPRAKFDGARGAIP